MKLFIILLLLSPVIGFAQNFEGEIVYHNNYKSKIASLSDQQFDTMMGNTQNWYIKDGNYKSETNGTFAKWQLYISKDNKLYSKLANSEAILWNDGATNTDSVVSIELHPNKVEILGYTCDELVLNCKSGVQKYYFTKKLPVSSSQLLKHKFGNWYTYLSKSNAVPLKMIIETPQCVLSSVAVEIKPMRLDRAMFLFPVGLKTIKSPYQ